VIRHLVCGKAHAYSNWICDPHRMLVATIYQIPSGSRATQGEKGDTYKNRLHKQSLSKSGMRSEVFAKEGGGTEDISCHQTADSLRKEQ